MKKLIMFLMVLAISVPAMATIDDSAPPLWGSATPRSTTVWQMESDPTTETYTPCEDGAVGAEWDSGSEGTWAVAYGAFTPDGILYCWAGVPAGSGTYVTVRAQLQLAPGSGTTFNNTSFEIVDPNDEWLGDIKPLTTTDEGDGLWVIEATGEFPSDGVSCGFFIDLSRDIPFQIKGIIMDILLHDSATPPTGSPRTSTCFPPIIVNSNDMPVHEPQDGSGPPPMGPTNGQLQVRLGWQPGEDLGYPNFTATVTVDPNEGDVPNEDFIFPDSTAGDGSVDLTFTQANWNVPQNVVVEAVQDLDEEGGQSYPIELTVTIDIADPCFGSSTPVVVTDSIGVVDNDIPFVAYELSDPCKPLVGTLSENDPCVPYCFDVRLSHVPTDDVHVLVDRDSGYNLLLESMSVVDPPLVADGPDPNKLTFTVSGNLTWNSTTMTSNWDVAQTICLEARDDDGLAEDLLEWVPGAILLNGTSDDPRYQSEAEGGELEETEVQFNVQDNDCGAWGYDPLDINKDCRVDLTEAAILYGQWLFCTDPYGDQCDARWNLVEE